MEDLFYRLNLQGLRLASVSKRAVAFFVDDLIVSLLVFVAFFDNFSKAKDIQEVLLLTNSLFFYIIVIKIIYHTFFVWQYGATMGKMLFKIKVVDEKTFLNLDFYHSFIRAVVRIFSEALFYLGFFWGVINPTKQTWHDKACGSVVIDV